jgi:peptidoglycan DL-endopeptidase CwlO
VEFLPRHGYGKTNSRGNRVGSGSHPARAWLRPTRARTAVAVGVAGMFAVALTGGTASAQPAGTPSSLQATVAQATALSNQIDVLGQQYDYLNIQLQQAKAMAAAAKLTAARDEKALKLGQTQVAQIAAEGYMTGSVNPEIELMQSSNPQTILDRSSILQQLSYEQGGKVNLLSQAEAAANRATQTAAQEQSQASKLAAQMSAKVAAIQNKENQLNSQVYAQALAVFQQTGSYPNIAVTGDSVGAQALKAALTRIGDPYVWAAAGPDEFDCSGLVMWAYEQVGIQLQHFTGSQWDEGEHIPESELAPGDLLFFFNLGHVGLFISWDDGGLMVDAPSAGQDVMIQQIPWGSFDGAVEIVA